MTSKSTLNEIPTEMERFVQQNACFPFDGGRFVENSKSNSFKHQSTLVPEVFLEPREGREEAKARLVTLDLNLTFMQTPGSASGRQVRIG